MKSIAHSSLGALLGFAFACGAGSTEATNQAAGPLTAEQMLAPIANDAGRAQTLASTGSIDTQNPFFQSL